MDPAWLEILLPIFMVIARVTAFFAILPLLAWTMVPVRIRLSMALLFSLFIGMTTPAANLPPESFHWINAILLIVRETLCGLALGLVIRLVFVSVQQGILIGTQQMGFADAGIIDPSTGEQARPLSTLFQMVFAVLFLSAGGLHLLLMAIFRSYEVFPIGQAPDPGMLAESIIDAGAAMLLFAMKLAAPMLAGFLLLSVMLGVVARVMPEMNILMASLPLRVALGMFLTMTVMRTMNGFVNELAEWIDLQLF